MTRPCAKEEEEEKKKKRKEKEPSGAGDGRLLCESWRACGCWLLEAAPMELEWPAPLELGSWLCAG